jgi:uncharacterized peroxidase-related enzyme
MSSVPAPAMSPQPQPQSEQEPQPRQQQQPQEASLYLPGVEAHPKPGVYRALIEAAKSRHAEYSKIWDLFAFQQDFTIHLARFTQGVLRQPATISPALRELIAAYTSYQNECRFCTNAHAAAAAELLADDALVWSALRDLEGSTLDEKEKALLRFVGKVTKNLPAIEASDIATLRSAGWDDEAIYYAITTCALFNFYNRWITATGVPAMSEEAHRQQGRMLASHGYVRD